MSYPNILLIGCGYWGSKILGKLLRNIPAEHITVVDPAVASQGGVSVEVADVFSGKVTVGSGYEEELELMRRGQKRFDAAIIATPPATHYEIAWNCLAAGLHVLCEKPLAFTQSGATHLASYAFEQRLVLRTDLTHLHDHRLHFAMVQGARKAVSERWFTGSGRPVTHIEWQGPGLRDKSANMLWTWGPHPVSIALASRPYAPVVGVEAFRYPTLGGDGEYIEIILNWSWGPQCRIVLWQHPKNLKAHVVTYLETGGKSALDLTDGLLDARGMDPLERTIGAFFSDCGTHNYQVEGISVETVRVLELAQYQLKQQERREANDNNTANRSIAGSPSDSPG